MLPIGRVSGELPTGITEVDNIFIFNLLLSLDQSQKQAEQLTPPPWPITFKHLWPRPEGRVTMRPAFRPGS
jgi:hypothetical protein